MFVSLYRVWYTVQDSIRLGNSMKLQLPGNYNVSEVLFHNLARIMQEP